MQRVRNQKEVVYNSMLEYGFQRCFQIQVCVFPLALFSLNQKKGGSGDFYNFKHCLLYGYLSN